MNLGLSLSIPPFSLSELKEIKRDLRSYTNNLAHYVQAFQQLTQLYDMAWKDIMLLLEQILTSPETQSSQSNSRHGEQLLSVHH
jgi:hypothetical protein